jgi:hypothetical protein
MENLLFFYKNKRQRGQAGMPVIQIYRLSY